jgi:hypothetical protein
MFLSRIVASNTFQRVARPCCSSVSARYFKKRAYLEVEKGGVVMSECFNII